MAMPTAYKLSITEIENLRIKFNTFSEVYSFSSDIKFASEIACYGMYREIGTVNDELARFIFNENSGKPVRLTSLKAELVVWDNLFGIRIWSTDTQNLELRTPGFYDVVHPQLSRNEKNELHSLYIFPEIINKIANASGVELVLVKSWGLNSIFGGFDPSKEYYQTNFWELENNDVLQFSELIRNSQIAFMGTHDLIAHIAGIDGSHWSLLKNKADETFITISKYFNSVKKPSIAALILPYTIGVVLDDLAQPPSYSSKSHIAMLDKLLDCLKLNRFPAGISNFLTEFPENFQEIINLSRTAGIENDPHRIQLAIDQLIQEILKKSFLV